MAKRTIERIVATVLLVAGAAWVAALGGFGSGFISDDPPAVNPYATGSTTTTAAGPVITIVGFAFGGDATVGVGQVLTVSNQSSSSHTFTARDDSFESGSIAAGTSFALTFDQPGVHEFFCRFHDGMGGTVTVTP